MAVKIIVLLALLAIVDAQENCGCDNGQILQEASDTFKFLKTLSPKVGEEYPIMPGLLSPLVSCDCGGNRKKRKTLPDTMNIVKEIRPTPKYEDHAAAGIRNKCPLGFRRIGFMCLNVDLL
ncbi:hypothetical protein RR48_01385 [Papilio machaon]|uniref:Uncharacterized protein n=1 Tax=Papilio machaon TaxID=76193 RepID=A0A0N0PDR7_PAPMA|nr:hypothetical protein RR48_01385 [Papilio machaon]